MKHMNLTLKKTLVPLALVATLAATQVPGVGMGIAKLAQSTYEIVASAENETPTVEVGNSVDITTTTGRGDTVYVGDSSTDAPDSSLEGFTVNTGTRNRVSVTVASGVTPGNYYLWYIGDGTSEDPNEMLTALTVTAAPTVTEATSVTSVTSVTSATSATTVTTLADLTEKKVSLAAKADGQWKQNVDVLAPSTQMVEKTVNLKFDKSKFNPPVAADFTISAKANAAERSPIEIKTHEAQVETDDGDETVEVENITIGEGTVAIDLQTPATTAKTTAYIFYKGKKCAAVAFTPTAVLAGANEKGTHLTEKGVLTYDGPATSLNIASSYKVGTKKVNVVEIDNINGKDATTDKAGIVTSVILPNTVTKINEGAFTPKKYGEGDFADAVEDKAGTIYVPDSVKEIAAGAFGSQVTVNCSDVVDVTVASFANVENGELSATEAGENNNPLAAATALNIKNGKVVVASGTEADMTESDYVAAKQTVTEGTAPDNAIYKTYLAGTTKAAGKLAVVNGSKVTFTNTAKFNKAIDVCRVSADGKTVYEITRVYVLPVQAAKWATASAKSSANKYEYSAITITPNASDTSDVTKGTATVKIYEGASVKLPYALDKAVADKTLTYQITGAAGNFTVVNGTIKGIKANGTPSTANLRIASASQPSTYIDVTVTVEAKEAKKLVANTSAITLEKGKTYQEFTLSTDSLTGAATATVAIDNDPACYRYSVDGGANWAEFGSDKKGTAPVVITNGSKTILVEALAASGDTVKYTKGSAKMSFTIGSNKPAIVTLKPVETGKKMYAMVSGFKATSAKKDIDIPVGTVYKMNMSVNPATADNRFGWGYYDGNTDSAKKWELLPTNITNMTDLTAEQMQKLVNAGKSGTGVVNYSINGVLGEGKTLTFDSGDVKVKTSGDSNSIDATPAELNACIGVYNNYVKTKSTGILEANGNILTAKNEGTVYIKAETLIGWGLISEKGNDMQPCATSDVYTVHVYNPSSSIAYPNNSVEFAESDCSDQITNYTIQGGFLIKEDETLQDSEYTFTSGEDVTMVAPKIADGNEEVIWSTNNDIACSVETGTVRYNSNQREINAATGTAPDPEVKTVDTLILNFNSPGTYTVTGMTKYTKQKFSFKVLVDTPAKDAWMGKAADADITAQYLNDSGVWTDVSGTNAIGSSVKGNEAEYKIRLDVNTANAGGTITFNKPGSGVTVNAKTGVVKVSKKAAAGDYTITATLTNKKDKSATVSKSWKVTVTAAAGATTT